MLRLRFARREPWVDSGAVRRSPWDRFNVLAPNAKEFLEQTTTHDMVAWEVAVVSDSMSLSEASKWMPTDGSVSYHAVDADEAPQHEGSARRLWHLVNRELQHYSLPATLLVKDFFRDAADRDSTIGESFAEAWRRQFRLNLRDTGRPGVYLVTGPTTGMDAALDTWWPSVAGFFSVIGGCSEPTHADRIAALGAITAELLPSVNWVVESSTSFENLGFRLLASRQVYEGFERQWLARGWSDGVPLLSVLGLTRDDQPRGLA